MRPRRTAQLWIPTVLAVTVGSLFLAAYRPDLPFPLLVDRYTNAESEFADVMGMRVHYRDEGRGGIPILLLHGTGASLHTWDGWVSALGYEYRVIRMDLPGFGLTGPQPAGDYRIQSYVEFVRAFADVLELPPFHLAGNSLGGNIAWNFALAYPDRVRKLVLIDASGYPDYSDDRAPNDSLIFRLSRLPGVNRLFESLTPRSLVASSLNEVYGDPSKISEELIDRYYELARRPGNRGAFVKRALDASQDVTGSPAAITQPTLIMWGAEDRWIPLADGRSFTADIPDSRLIVYPGVGHLPMEEIPGPSARAALSFLKN